MKNISLNWHNTLKDAFEDIGFNPPPTLLDIYDAATPRMQTEDGGGGKRQRRNTLSTPNQDDAGTLKQS